MALEGVDLEADFTCKWSVIEKALFKAVSKEQNTIRLENFLERGHFFKVKVFLLFNYDLILQSLRSI